MHLNSARQEGKVLRSTISASVERFENFLKCRLEQGWRTPISNLCESAQRNADFPFLPKLIWISVGRASRTPSLSPDALGALGSFVRKRQCVRCFLILVVKFSRRPLFVSCSETSTGWSGNTADRYLCIAVIQAWFASFRPTPCRISLATKPGTRYWH